MSTPSEAPSGLPGGLPSGWFPDPHGRHEYRWFNGRDWTADVSDDGRRMVDPYGAAPLGFRPTGEPGGSGPNPFGSTPPGNGNGIATAAITCGLIGLLFAWMPVFVVIGATLAVLGLIFGIRGLKRSRRTGSGRGKAITGIVSGAAGLGLSIVGIVLSVSMIREVVAFIEPGAVSSDVVACTVADGEIVVEATVTNLSERTRGYTVYAVMRWPRVGDLVTTTDDVAPDETRPVTLERIYGGSETTCEARLVVQGPLPYGVEMDRTNDE